MKRQERRSTGSFVLLSLLSFQPQVALAQEGRSGETRGTTKEVLIWRIGEPYEVPPLRIRLLDEATGAPLRLISVRVAFMTRWLASSKPDYHGPGGSADILTEAVTDVDGYFSTSKTEVVPRGLTPTGDNPLFVPRFVGISVSYEVAGGSSWNQILPETIESVRSGKLAYIELGSPPKAAEPSAALTEADVVVKAAVDWSNSRVRVQRGDTIRVTARGTIDLGRQGSCGPQGIGTVDPDALLPDKPLGALIAVIGDDNDDFIFIGSEAEFVAPHDGCVFFGVNEGDTKDNSGTFTAHVRVRPTPN